MARPESIALGGYFPTPQGLLPSLASLVSFTSREAQILVDPCAGDATAIAGLRKLWFEAEEHASILAVELERERADAHRAHLNLYRSPDSDESFHGDAFHIEILPKDGASLLFLNPPYDFDKAHGRLEQRFLERWTAALVPGDGLLLFLVPFYALSASARFLACNFQDIRAWRFPGASFDAFKQCVLVARRRSTRIPDNLLDERRIERWAADAGSLPELQTLPEAPYRVHIQRAGLELTRRLLDVSGLLEGFQPWHRAAFAGLDRGVRDMIGAKFPVAQPPRPAHIALALTVGTLNGKELSPDHPGLPRLLVKGSFRRDYQTVEDRFNKDGDFVGSVKAQRPKLSIRALRLDTLDFLEFKPGTTPSGARDLADFNSADLVDNYGKSLGQLMREQFPALHDPANPAHQIELPPLSRKPYHVQSDAIMTGLKLLAQGENLQAMAEVGTGKSTVALSIVGALSPLHFRHTTRELQRLGFDTSQLSPVRRTLIVCPPHLLKSWRDQAAAVLPEHRVVTVESIADLHQEAEIFVLSREQAKLGSGVEGVGAKDPRQFRCPRCGAKPEEDSPAELAETRARCTAVSRLPINEEARIAEDLAAALVASYPYSPLVRTLVSRHRILTLALPAIPEMPEGLEIELPPPGPPPARDRLRPIVHRLFRLLVKAAFMDYRLREVLEGLCRAAGFEAEIAALFRHRAQELTAQATAARELTDDDYHETVFKPRRRGEELRELAARMEATPRPGASYDLSKLLTQLCDLGSWEESLPCGESLFQATPNPRRFPLARYILRYCRRQFGLLIVDEWHEYSNKGSAQQKAAHRLVELPGVPTIALTGSLMGGYASSLFANQWALSQRFRKRFRPWEEQAFITAYGYRKIFVPADAEAEVPQVVSYGSKSDRERTRQTGIRQEGQAPGVLPSFILEHLLPGALIMHKEDLDQELPPCVEVPVPIQVTADDANGKEMLNEFRRLLSELTRKIRADQFTNLAGKLWGAMSELPSYLDRCTSDLEEFVLSYPKDVGGEVVATGKMFPSSWVPPKERWILDSVRASIEEGRNVLVFLRHTGGRLPARYLRLFKEHLGQHAVFLDVRKVKASSREDWLNEHVIDPGRRILVTNPKAVQTGLNNLVHFSRAIWVEGVDYDARVVRQANGRLHRIGQTQDVRIEVPFYNGTVQKTALDLVARKVSSSVQVDGLSIEGALESAGAGDGEANRAAMGMGQAIYEAWVGR